MSAELARHLLQSGAIPAEEVHAALLDVVTLGVPFVQALVSRGGPVGARLETELARLRVPTVHGIRVQREIAARLPAGMCARLLALPLGMSSSGEVEVACVDPLDPAVGTEFSHQLRRPVKIMRASLGDVLGAIERWIDEREAERRSSTPPLGAGRAERVEEGLDFALGQVSFERFPTRAGVGPEGSVLDEPPPDSSGQPVISLVRSKPVSARPPLMVDAEALDRVPTPDEVVHKLAELASGVAACAIVLKQRAGVHEARAASAAFSDELSSLGIVAGPASVPELAAQAGHFLGPLPDDDAHRALRARLGSGEVYATPVFVSGRPALTLVLAGMKSSLESTRIADDLARRAALVLERILREKKRSR